MDTFFKFFYEFLSQFFSGFIEIFKGIWYGIKAMFNIPEYLKIINKIIIVCNDNTVENECQEKISTHFK